MGAFEELDTDEPLDKRLERHAYDRLIMLSDGVFAIALTLMALEVKIPPGWTGSLDTLITTASVSAVVSYVVSFMVVAIYWMGNRRVLAMFRRVDGVSSLIALVMLMLVALLPPISRTLVTEQGTISESSLLYVGYITLIGVVQAPCGSTGASSPNCRCLADHPLQDLHAGVDAGGAHGGIRNGHAVDERNGGHLALPGRRRGHDPAVRDPRPGDEAVSC